jgi:hypothetical protein
MKGQNASEARNALKTATKQLVTLCGGLEAAASCTRVGTSQLSDYGNINSEKVVPADVALDLEVIAGGAPVTATLARLQGYALVRVIPLREQSELATMLARIGKDTGELFSTAAVALSHKTPTVKERNKLISELDELRQATSDAMFFLQKEG